jgi:hypothetical protein
MPVIHNYHFHVSLGPPVPAGLSSAFRRDRYVARVAARRALPPRKLREPKLGRGQQLGQWPLHTHRSALLSTSRFGFAGVPNALNLKRGHLRLFEVALVVASWRFVLCCSRRNAPSPLRLACCARGHVVLYRSRGRAGKRFIVEALNEQGGLWNRF